MTAPEGFHTSPRRLLAEFGLFAGLLGTVIALGWWSLRYLSHKLVGFVPPEVERSLGELAWDSLAPQEERCTNQRTLQYVGDVLRPLLAQQPPGFRFRYTVVDREDLNAFALPGGFITVNMGLLQHIQRSEELAGVLAHELAHVTQHHATQRMAAQLGSLTLVGLIFGVSDTSAAAQALVTLGTTAYAREQEAEADAVGLQTLTAAHIDPLGMAEMFERIAREQPNLPELLSTHPDPGKRAERARAAENSATHRPLVPLPKGLTCR